MSKLTPLQAKLLAKLEGGQFRYINEKLYTQSGDDSLDMMKKDPSMFDAYHAGYRSQVEGWPLNPLDIMISEVRKQPEAIVGDFGCGEARLAASVKNKVHSFDLVAANERVVACNIAHVPLPPDSLDIAVYCLSLMGTDFIKFLREARRTLKPSGRLLIAEVKSRFETEHADGSAKHGAGHVCGTKRKRDNMSKSGPEKAAGGLPKFIHAVKQLGFQLEKMDDRNTMFVLLFFRKVEGPKGEDPKPVEAETKKPLIAGPPPSKPAGKGKSSAARPESAKEEDSPLLKACIYKRR